MVHGHGAPITFRVHLVTLPQPLALSLLTYQATDRALPLQEREREFE
jgi:hypothetical protein